MAAHPLISHFSPGTTGVWSSLYADMLATTTFLSSSSDDIRGNYGRIEKKKKKKKNIKKLRNLILKSRILKPNKVCGKYSMATNECREEVKVYIVLQHHKEASILYNNKQYSIRISIEPMIISPTDY